MSEGATQPGSAEELEAWTETFAIWARTSVRSAKKPPEA